jgi:tape measure domain-containing protein
MATDVNRIVIEIAAKDQASGALKNVSSSVGNLGAVAGGILGAAALGGLISKLKQVGIAAVSGAAQMEQSEIAFTAMLGSAQKAGELLKDITKFARETPFDLPSVRTGVQRLVAMGIATKDTIPTLKVLGDVIAGVGGNADVLDRMIYNIGQIKSLGHATAIDMRQFAIATIPMVEALTASLGVSSAELDKMVEEGKIGYPEIMNALIGLTSGSGKFADMMKKQTASMTGLWSNLKDSIGIALAEIARRSGVFDILKRVLVTLTADGGKLIQRLITTAAKVALLAGAFLVGVTAVLRSIKHFSFSR